MICTPFILISGTIILVAAVQKKKHNSACLMKENFINVVFAQIFLIYISKVFNLGNNTETSITVISIKYEHEIRKKSLHLSCFLFVP